MSCLEYSTITYRLPNGFFNFEKRFFSALSSNNIWNSRSGSSAFANNDWILTMSSWEDVYCRTRWPLAICERSFMSILLDTIITFASIISHHRIVIHHHWLLVENWYIRIVYHLIYVFAEKSLKFLKTLYFKSLLLRGFLHHHDDILSENKPFLVRL